MTAPESQQIFLADPPSPVQAFCQRYELLPDLNDTLALIQQIFTVAEPLELTAEVDPETGEEWLEIRVAARGQTPGLAEARRDYNRKWRASAPKKITDNVRLFLHVVE